MLFRSGSSGVGKSTIINRLLKEEKILTAEIDEHDKGRHTTTRRELFILPNGGIVIDTPGMREVGLEEGNLHKTFSDIEELASQCRFADCSHRNEPGCMILQALSEGSLTIERLESYRKLQQELVYQQLNAKEIEQEKIHKMFGSKKEMKQMRDKAKKKKSY